MPIDTTRIPNERVRRAADNYERINRENKDLRRDVDKLIEGFRSMSAIVTAGRFDADLKHNVADRLKELDLLPVEEGPQFEEPEVPEDALTDDEDDLDSDDDDSDDDDDDDEDEEDED